VKHRLGKSSVLLDSRTLQFARYAVTVPTPPSSCNWAAAVARWRALGNLRIGDCTAVMVAHATQAMLANEIGQQWIPPYNAVIRFYSATSGYIPGRPRTDVGAAMLTVMNRWRRVGLAGHKIEAYTSLDWTNALHLRQSIWLMGAAALGVAMPLSVQSLLAPGSVWDVPAGGPVGDGAPGSWGGHAIPLLAYDAVADLYLAASWNATYTLTAAFVNTYCDEAYCPFSSQDWSRTDYAPNGFATVQLRADLAAITTAHPATAA
jgi:hypothetical protein